MSSATAAGPICAWRWRRSPQREGSTVAHEDRSPLPPWLRPVDCGCHPRDEIDRCRPLLASSGGLRRARPPPLTHEALWLMKRVGAPTPSPDGRWVVFSGYGARLRRQGAGGRPVDRARRRQRHAASSDLRQGGRGRSRLEPGQPSHRLLDQARRRRGRAGLRPRRDRRRRGVPRHLALHRRAQAQVAAGRQCAALHERGVPRRARTTRRRRRSRRTARLRSSRCAPTTASRSATGTSGSTTRRRTSSCRPSSRGPRRRTFWPGPGSWRGRALAAA